MNRMRSKVGKKKTVIDPTALDEAWQPKRYQRRWNRVWRGRGKDKKLYCLGQEPDEIVRKVVRKHPFFLVKPALPILAAIVLLFLVFWGALTLPSLGALWTLLEIIVVGLIIVATGWFIWRDFIVWWLSVDIITNKRLIHWRGFLQPSRTETPVDRVQQIAIDQDTPWQFLLGYGNVHVYVTGGEVVLKDVPHPRKVKDAIQGITQEFRATKPPKEKPPEVDDPEMNALLEKLGESKPIPKLPDPDDKYPPLKEGKRLGPRRTFGGPFRIPCEVRYSWGESTVMYIQKAPPILVAELAVPVFILLLVLPLAIYGTSSRIVPSSFVQILWFTLSLLVLGLLITIILIYINFADDVYILTNRRLIEIERKLVFLYEERIETEYKNIRDIHVKIPHVIGYFFDIGNVYIETPGNNPDVTFRNVAHPFFIQDKIYELKGLKDKIDEIKKENGRNEELHSWFGNVIGALEAKPQFTFKEAPKLQGKDLLEAMDIASDLGLQVVVWGEEPVNSATPPGQVIHQNPPPGTVIGLGGEIQVVLSRRPTPADQI